jgi:putative membrane protein
MPRAFGGIVCPPPIEGGHHDPEFSNHAANERTYLARVRTALAIAGFGILIPKFDLLPGDLGLIGGFSLVAVASGMLILSTARFISASREIDDSKASARAAFGVKSF